MIYSPKNILGIIFFLLILVYLNFRINKTLYLKLIIFFVFSYMVSLIKILIRRNSFIGFLLILEFIVIICFSFLVFYCRINRTGRILTYFFLVLSVSICVI